MRGVVVYRGDSMIDGKPIIGVVTFRTVNEKIGDMAQLWIMRSDIPPVEAVKTGADSSVCGNCPHRPANQGTCYVLTHQAPSSIYYACQRGLYPDYDGAKHIRRFKGKLLRLGAYGNPTAIPYDIMAPIMGLVEGHTGYTHDWRTCDQRWRKWLMASVDSAEDYNAAKALNWRTYRVLMPNESLGANERICPAQKSGNRINCETCLACSGTSYKAPVDFAVMIHGWKGESWAKRQLKMQAA